MQAQNDGTGHESGAGRHYEGLTPWRMAVNTMTVLAVLLVAAILMQVKEILVLFLIGILLASAIEPIVGRLTTRGLGRGQAVLIVYAFLFIILGGLLAILVPTVIGEVVRFFSAAPKLIEDLRESVRTSQSVFIRENGPYFLDQIENRIAQVDIPTERALTLATYLPSIFGYFIQGLITIVTALMVTFYWLTEKQIIKRVFLSFFVSDDRRSQALTIWDDIETKLGGWIRGQLILMGIIGVVASIGYSLMGVKFALLLGVIAGLCEIIPFFGPWISGVPAVFLALTQSWRLALGVAAFILVIQLLEGNILVPRVMKGSVGLSPLLVVLAVLVGATLLGPVGGIIAIPIAAAIQVLITNMVRSYREGPTAENTLPPTPTFNWRPNSLPRRLQGVKPGPAIVGTAVEFATKIPESAAATTPATIAAEPILHYSGGAEG